MGTSANIEQRKVWSEPTVTGSSEMKFAQATKNFNGTFEGSVGGDTTGPAS